MRVRALIVCLLAGTPLSAQAITALYYTGTPTDNIARGTTATLTPAAGYTFRSGGGPEEVNFSVANFSINEDWDLSLAMPQGHPIAVGTYLNAGSYPFEAPTDPGILFDGVGRADNQVTGHFTILEVMIANGQIVSFAADFTQVVGGDPASWVYGSIRYNSTIPLNVLPPIPVQPLSVACTNGDAPEQGLSYDSTCVAGGGVGPYTWAIVDGQLPPGIGMGPSNPRGSLGIVGVTQVAGLYAYTVQVTDSRNHVAYLAFASTNAVTTCLPSGHFEPPGQTPNAFPALQLGINFGWLGGTNRFLEFVLAQSAGCPWSLASDVPGVTFESGSTFGSTFFSTVVAQSNLSRIPLQGHIFLIVGGVVVDTVPIVVNSSACSYWVNQSSGQFPVAGGPAPSR